LEQENHVERRQYRFEMYDTSTLMTLRPHPHLAKHSYKNTLFYKILQSVILTLHNCIKLTLKDPTDRKTTTIKTPNNKT